MKSKNKKKKAHLIGICGTGMSALAVLLKEAGWQVSGSDQDVFGSIPSYLKKNKITFYEKYDERNVPKDADLVVIGNNIPLSVLFNPEKKYAVEAGLPTQSLPEVLAMLSESTENIVVVGSSGKSSMTALLSWCLVKGKEDPSYFIGAMPLDLKNSGHIGKGKDFVLEGDEYTSSKTDKRSKFLHFNPASVLLTSASHDHINIFPTEKSYREPYKKLVAKIRKSGLLVYALNGKNNKEIAKHTLSRTVSYGLNNKADWYAENIHYGLYTSFDLVRKEKNKKKKIATIKTTLLGKHNIENIVGAGALLLENKKITKEVFTKAIASFHGIKNRIEPKTKNSRVPVYEGFGSSYEKARSIFEAIRLHFPNRRMVAIFEPHAFSWRNRKFLKWYENVFKGVDEVLMLPAASHGKVAKNQLTSEEVWGKAKKYKNIYTVKNEKEGLRIIEKIVKENDVIVLVSSGPLLGLNLSVPRMVQKMFPRD